MQEAQLFKGLLGSASMSLYTTAAAIITHQNKYIYKFFFSLFCLKKQKKLIDLSSRLCHSSHSLRSHYPPFITLHHSEIFEVIIFSLCLYKLKEKYRQLLVKWSTAIMVKSKSYHWQGGWWREIMKPTH